MSVFESELIKMIMTAVSSGIATWVLLRTIFEKFVNQQNFKNEIFDKLHEKHEHRFLQIENMINQNYKEASVEFQDIAQALHNFAKRQDNLEAAQKETHRLSQDNHSLLKEVNKHFIQIIHLLKPIETNE